MISLKLSKSKLIISYPFEITVIASDKKERCPLSLDIQRSFPLDSRPLPLCADRADYRFLGFQESIICPIFSNEKIYLMGNKE